MLSLNDAPNYSTSFYLWRTQGGATQRGTPGYCVVHHLQFKELIYQHTKYIMIVFSSKFQLFSRFRAGIKDLEVMMQNVITTAFETVKTVEQGVELLDAFQHLSSREVNASLTISLPTN